MIPSVTDRNGYTINVHGTGGYVRGCRCEVCRDARNAYCREWRARRRKPPITAAERFWAKVDKSADCWLWRGATTAGYGSIRIGGKYDGKSYLAHRVSYEMAHGPIPDGLHIDHTCKTRRCVNPAHLEAVTQAENNRREAERRTTCVAGRHPWPESKRRRQCGICADASAQRRKALA